MYKVWNRVRTGIEELMKSRAFVVIIVFCLLAAILVGRLFDLQIVNGQKYLDDYKLLIQKTRVLQGTRGNIYDRNGKLLAYNALAYSVTIEDNYPEGKSKNEALNEEIHDLISLIEMNGDSVINDFGIILDSNNEYTYAMGNETLKLRFIADVFGKRTIDELKDEQKNMSAGDIIHHLCTDKLSGYGIDEDAFDKEYVLKMINIRYAINLNSYQKFIPVTIAEDVSDATVAAIMENTDSLPGVAIAEESMRRYTNSECFANVIGYTGQISQEEFDSLDDDQKEKYSLTDTIGKSGIEKVMDETLQGKKGEEKLYVNSVGKVIEKAEVTNSKPGNNLYLSIDADLQVATYNLLEQELAGILLSKMQDILDYDRSQTTDARDVIVASGDIYNAFIDNDILDSRHFFKKDAGPAEQEVAAAFTDYKKSVLASTEDLLNDTNAKAYKDYPREWQAYMSYIVNDFLTNQTGIIMKDSIDTEDETYLKWRKDETININKYLNHLISKNWIDTSKIQSYMESSEKYSDATEIYKALTQCILESLKDNQQFDKLIYRYMIKSGRISGRQICMMVYEQGILEMEDANYQGLNTGSLGAYDFIRSKIQTLEITPGQLGIEPCTASMVMTDTNTGEVLACVSYPGYDNNRLANKMDSDYYNQLLTSTSRPLYNNATQEKTAPGSTFKPLSAIAGLTEGVVDEGTTVYCDGVFDKIEPNVKCWIYPESHGQMNVVSGIANSCNEYFGQLALNLGMKEVNGKEEYSSEKGLESLSKYAKMFGLDQTSGMEIPESTPQISDEDAVRSAIGQGTHNYTTSQLARYITAVANKGTVYDLTLLNRTEKVDGTVIKEYSAKTDHKVDEISNSTWSLVHKGMRGVVQNNSLFNQLNSNNYEVSGKTGTAQQSATHPDHGLFVGFAPSSSPEVAFAIRIANGYGSSFTSEVGKNVMEYYFGLTTIEDILENEANTVETASHHGD